VLGRVLARAPAETRERPPKGFGRGWVAMEGPIEGPEAKEGATKRKKEVLGTHRFSLLRPISYGDSHFVVFST
jgi:hypothetical protein